MVDGYAPGSVTYGKPFLVLMDGEVLTARREYTMSVDTHIALSQPHPAPPRPNRAARRAAARRR